MNNKMEKVISLAKQRGYIFQSSEIYGGLKSAYDYGPLGVELKRNLMNEWWRSMVHEREDVIEVENLKGFAIFFNMEKFKNNEFFDENYFLYFEEIDLCRKVYRSKGKIYLDPKIKIFHEGGKSVDKNYSFEIEKNRNWHWMWSTFYYHKKHYNFFYALIIVFPKLFSAFFKSIFYTLTLKKEKRDIYYCRLSGLINSILGKKSWYRPNLN